jgi:hypothetical protein
LSDDGWVQASLAIDAGGLGMRESQGLALLAFIASRTTARPLVEEMAKHTEEAGLCQAALCMNAYDTRTNAAIERWVGELPPGVHMEVRLHIDEGAEAAVQRWRTWCEGRESPAHAGGDQGESLPNAGAGVIGRVGLQDAEHPGNTSSSNPLHVQQRLSKVVDQCAAQGLVNKFTSQEQWGALHRLADISSPEANHEWLWAVHPHKTKRLEADEYVTAVRLRLGCGGPEEPAICGNCGNSIIACDGEHGLLCAKGESTRGHNAIRDELHNMALPVDANAETEPEGLIASHPRLRPADVLTGAFHNGRLAAVDVGVICPSAAGAGVDCVATMDQRKRDRMEPFRGELDRAGVEFHPFAVSCWGRLHPTASQMLHRLAKRTARRQGLTNQRAVFHQLNARITTEVMRRAARMVLHCLPHVSDDAGAYQGGSDELLSPCVVSRAGDPSTADMPPYSEALPSGA